MSRPILINQSYGTQRVTGQQRYAAEISARLEPDARYAVLRPRGFWAASALRAWAWVQLVLPVIAGPALVLSMTSRAPLWRQRHVLVVHDLFVLTNPEWYSRIYVWTHAPLLRAQIRSAAVIVAVSQPVADQLSTRYDKPVVVAPNAPSAVFSRTGELGDIAVRLDLTAGEYFLVVGSKDPRKNLGRLAAAYGRLSESERRAHPLVVVGGGSSIYRGEQVEWPSGTVEAGYVSDEELRDLYRGARTVVFGSLAEGFGLPLVEAAAAGATSLLVSDIEVFRWICGDQARYVDPESVEAIAAGLRTEIADPRDARLDLGRFDWDVSARVIATACERVAAGNSVNEKRLR